MFEKMKAWIAEHPYLSGAAVLAIGAVFLLVRSVGSASAATNADGSAATNDDDVEIANINAGANAANVQAQSAVSIAQIQADAQNTQVEAAANAQNIQTLAELSAQQDYDASQVAAVQSTNDATTAQLGLQTNMFNQIYGEYIQSGVTENADNNATTVDLVTNQQDIQSQEIQTLVNTLGANRGTTLSETLAEIMNPGSGAGVGVATATASGTAAVAAAYQNSAIINLLGNLGTSIVKGLT